MTEEKEHDEHALKKEWFAKARKQTLETLPAFLQELADFHHDYGSIVMGVSAAAIGAMSALDKSPNGGITGFQAGCVMWEFIREVRHNESPLALIDFGSMLYPQNARSFKREIAPSVWKWLQEEAAKLLEKQDGVHPEVVQHWRSIIAGQVPFSWTVRQERSDEEPA